MRCGSSFWLVCLATICFLAGCGESSAQAPPPAVAPFDAAQAKVHQKVWADHLGLPVESKNTIGMSFMLIPSGEFLMGSPESEDRIFGDFEAQRRVKITSSFLLGVHEVTQSQYESVMGRNPSHFKGANNPVEQVSWRDAEAFCAKLSSLPAEVAAGRVYRLPTDAEWEYACRAGTTTAYSFGDDAEDLGEYAWFRDNSTKTPHEVGKKRPNGWGLYDMHGNVWEWCEDEGRLGPSRVFRGGCWDFVAAACRSALRLAPDSSFRLNDLGFRLALSSPSVKSPEAEQPVAGQAPPRAVAPFDAAQAKVHQKVWADHLGLPVESKNTIGMSFMLIPSGEFLMGSPSDEAYRYENEGPQHRVRITKAFYMGVTEVTQGQWFAVMKTKPWGRQQYVKEGDAYPATYVTWHDAVEYCGKLSALEGKEYRLPTEAEWEYTCRGGKSTAYSFGSDASGLKNHAWFTENADDIGEEYAHEVGGKQPNPFGLYDMHGNVQEWCSDTNGDYSSSAVVDPVGPPTGEARVFRGGSWRAPGLQLRPYDAAGCRAAFRSSNLPTLRLNDLGFRLALSSPSGESPEAEPGK